MSQAFSYYLKNHASTKNGASLCNRGRGYISMKNTTMRKFSTADPRWFQAGFQCIFLTWGLAVLHWPVSAAHCIASVGGCIFFQYAFESARQRRLLPVAGPEGFMHWGFSVLISALSLCLLLRTNHWGTSLLAACITVGSKYVLRFRGSHMVNPSAFGIVMVLWLTNDAWLSPGQWGQDTVLFFAIATLGTIVVTRVQKLDVSLAFIAGFAGLMAWRQLYVLGWPADHFVHTLATGSLLLFSFFMISDPRTAPAHPVVRVLWGFAIGATAFYLAAFKWMYNTPLIVLVLAAPLVPVLNYFFPSRIFQWQQAPLPFLSTLKKLAMRLQSKKAIAASLLLIFTAQHAFAFCGFYVSKADGTLKNKTSQVILVRDGDKTVITMYNDFKGDFREFAMVVPVPVVLKQEQIHVVDPQIFTTLNEYSQPRLVEYFDEDPCDERRRILEDAKSRAVSAPSVLAKPKGVRVEARYLVGEYDIMLLSAKESTGLRDWLNQNGYKIPPGADEVLEPYIKSNLKFFVAKVNENELKKLKSNFLRPLQISFRSPKFMLPIRLGMANADGDQDLIVYAFSRSGRVECTNYRTVPMPTGQEVPLFVQKNFSRFYGNTFARTWQNEGQSVALLEYAWDVSPQNYLKCDPCVGTAPSTQDLVQSGVWWVNNGDGQMNNENVFFTRLHFRYNRKAFPQELIFQPTPNNEAYQARYVITHPAPVSPGCQERKAYQQRLRERRVRELRNLHQLSGESYRQWAGVENINEPAYALLAAEAAQENTNYQWAWWGGICLAVGVGVFGMRRYSHG
jgi:hypothetical protein